MAASDNSKRITAIDGYRAIAILVIMLHHVPFAAGCPAWLASIMPFVPRAVIAFWVLSGFLITRSILSEEKRDGAIQFRHFYARQAIRFFVPLLAYLVLIGVFISLRYRQFDWWSLARPALLDPNTYCIAPGVMHLYSMVLQIYFWLAWPVVLKIAPAPFRVSATSFLILASLVWKFYGQTLAMQSGSCLGRVDFYFTPLLIGSFLALTEPYLLRLKTWRYAQPGFITITVIAIAILIFTRSPLSILSSISSALGAVALSLRGNSFITSVYGLVQPLAISVAWASLVFLVVNNVVPFATRVLSFPGLTWLGRISFSVYLWQNVFCFGLTESRLDTFPLNLLASIICGYLAYRLIELPSLRWRSKIKKRSAISPGAAPATGLT
jgi:peptidoglycan/LPS O-acetylase OafA/YrhL